MKFFDITVKIQLEDERYCNGCRYIRMIGEHTVCSLWPLGQNLAIEIPEKIEDLVVDQTSHYLRLFQCKSAVIINQIPSIL